MDLKIPPIQDIDLFRDFLDEQADRYNTIDFIKDDPVQMAHRFRSKPDIEIAAFITATISWGTRKSILVDAQKIFDWMGNAPHDFVINFEVSQMKDFRHNSVHRTFNREDLQFFVQALQKLYRRLDSMESLFSPAENEHNYYHAIERFRAAFFEDEPAHRAVKHVSSPYKNSAAKRLMMFLRWMVRRDKRGVDLGLWQKLPAGKLSIPLDVHTGNISRQLQLLSRKQNDWKAVEELDAVIRQFDAEDPAKYDFALFGLGVSGALKIE